MPWVNKYKVEIWNPVVWFHFHFSFFHFILIWEVMCTSLWMWCAYVVWIVSLANRIRKIFCCCPFGVGKTFLFLQVWSTNFLFHPITQAIISYSYSMVDHGNDYDAYKLPFCQMKIHKVIHAHPYFQNSPPLSPSFVAVKLA